MMHLQRWTSAMLCLALLAPSVTHAQESFDTSACHGNIEGAMGARLREYRGAVLGMPKAADASVGTVRYDNEGNPWLKTDGTSWRSAAEGFSGTTWSNAQMDNRGEFKARLGILEQKKVTTSELLPALLQSVRALECKLDTVCASLTVSLGAQTASPILGAGGEPGKVQSPGCLAEAVVELPACRERSPTGSDGANLLAECTSMRQAIMTREAQLLKFLVAYDAAHRTLRQFMGLLETFTLDLRTTLLGPVWQAVRAFHTLGRIPCFSSQCEL